VQKTHSRERSPCSRTLEICRFQRENKSKKTLQASDAETEISARLYVNGKNNIKSAFSFRKNTKPSLKKTAPDMFRGNNEAY
jgi:hypothetical protein